MTIGKKKKARSFGDLHCDEVLWGERLNTRREIHGSNARKRERKNPFAKGRRRT